MINLSRYNNIEATIIFLATNNNNNDLYTDRISIYPKKNTRQLLKFYIYIIFFRLSDNCIDSKVVRETWDMLRVHSIDSRFAIMIR